MSKTTHRKIRGDVLEGAPLHYAPANELGVVFLFAHLAKRWRLRVDTIRPEFPDCIAYQKTQHGEKRIRIEFEYKSRNFKTHRHDPKKCDWIVCWEHNWPEAPRSLEIVELRREFGLGFNIWIVPINSPYKEVLSEISQSGKWSAPSQAHKGDLVLFYLTRPEMCIAHVFRLDERASKVGAHWKGGQDYMASVRKVCTLDAPIFLEDMRRHRVLSTASFVRGQMRGRPNATEYWPYLYGLIIRRNPSLKHRLKDYAPEEI